MKIEQQFNGSEFTFRIEGEELVIPLAGHSNGAEIARKALAWARQINPNATLDD